MEAFAGEYLVVGGVSTGPTPAVYAPTNQAPAERVLIDVRTTDVRARWDGGSVGGLAGVVLPVGGVYVLDGARNVSRLQLIRHSAIDANVYLSYERP